MSSDQTTPPRKATARELFTRTSLRLPSERVRDESSRQSSKSFAGSTPASPTTGNASFASVKAAMHTQLLEDLDRRDRVPHLKDKFPSIPDSEQKQFRHAIAGPVRNRKYLFEHQPVLDIDQRDP